MSKDYFDNTWCFI